MKRILFFGLLSATALFLTACPQTPPPPPPSACAPTATGLSVQGEPTQLLDQLAGLGDFTAPHVPGDLLVLPGGLTPQSVNARVPEVRIQASLPGGFLHVRVPPGQEKVKAGELLKAGARYVQPNYLYFPLYIPNDPLYPASLQDKSRLRPFYQAMNLEAAWDVVAARAWSCNPVVAVLDTAFNPDHLDLRGNLLPGKNQTPDGLPQDDLRPSSPPNGVNYGQGEPDHGQAVAGLIAAIADNGEGIPGVGLNRVKVLPVKVFFWVWNGDRQTWEYISTSVVLSEAIRYAADRQANVITMSLGSPTPLDRVVQDALNYALSKGSLPVAAAGNDGTDGLRYPARYPGVLAVGSVRLDGTRSDFSNYSSTPATLVMAAAGNLNPAQSLWSLALGTSYPYYPNGNLYLTWRGTSFAAPQVSGVAALYVGEYATRRGRAPTPDQIKTCLIQTASNGGYYNLQTGYGVVQAHRVMTDTTYCFP
ncbi:S8 family serine peptidase [uncultured Thermus sp.]|uniref:S8 family peptidase n=1 Tax=uncultured Thermus sp. TaxID=157149 RepID=UPI00260988B0|nr:S8 family serine peptidase [uncultured Thermus sp.]